MTARLDERKEARDLYSIAIDLAYALRRAVKTEFPRPRLAALERWESYVRSLEHHATPAAETKSDEAGPPEIECLLAGGARYGAVHRDTGVARPAMVVRRKTDEAGTCGACGACGGDGTSKARDGAGERPLVTRTVAEGAKTR